MDNKPDSADNKATADPKASEEKVDEHGEKKTPSEENSASNSRTRFISGEAIFGNLGLAGAGGSRTLSPVEAILGRGKRARNYSAGSPPTSPLCQSPNTSGFFFGMTNGLAASPPRFVSLEEIMKAAKGVSNMALAHEIAVDKNFKLQKAEPPEDSLHHQVKETVHRAFWDCLSSQLDDDPPSYAQAIVLLAEVKQSLLDLLLPHHTRVKQNIEEVLDVDLIRQQAEQSTLDFQNYAQYIISIMSKLCAPVRDDKIRELMQVKEIVPLFKGILETLELMRLDMANFTIEQIRPHIQAQSVDYERKKFEEFLETQQDGLLLTRLWLKKHLPLSDSVRPLDDSVGSSSSSNGELTCYTIGATIADAFVEVLNWDEEKNVFPETLLLDRSRFLNERDELRKISLIASIMLVVLSSVSTNLQNDPSFKATLKDHLVILLKEADATTESSLDASIPSVAAQIIVDVRSKCEQTNRLFDKEQEKALEERVLAMADPNHKVRHLVRLRTYDFIRQVISCTTASPVKIPPGLSSVQEELTQLAGTFLRLVSHNRAVFGEHYARLIKEHCVQVATAEQSTSDAVATEGATATDTSGSTEK